MYKSFTSRSRWYYDQFQDKHQHLDHGISSDHSHLANVGTNLSLKCIYIHYSLYLSKSKNHTIINALTKERQKRIK